MRHVHCKECAKDHPVDVDKKVLFEASEDGEPAEYLRVRRGVAKVPMQEQRKIYLNDVPHKLEAGHYDCDRCGKMIRPGEECACVTVWTSRQTEPPAWETDFIEKFK